MRQTGAISTTLLCGLIGLGCAKNELPHTRLYPTAFVGNWVAVYPFAGLRDTLRLSVDGTASGSGRAFGELDWPATAWRPGPKMPEMPDGICITVTERVYCMAARVRNDTMALANGQGTVLVRAAALARNGISRGSESSSAPTARLAVPPPSTRREP